MASVVRARQAALADLGCRGHEVVGGRCRDAAVAPAAPRSYFVNLLYLLGRTKLDVRQQHRDTRK